MKILIVCPIPVEFNSCREILSLRDMPALSGCRTGRASIGGCELFAIEAGPAKARAAGATVSGILTYKPHLVLDSGSCAGTAPGAVIGEVVICQDCFESDISGTCFPQRSIPEMRLPSAFAFLPAEVRDSLQKEAVERGGAAGVQARVGNQVCGELLIQSLQMRDQLYRLFQAAAGNWETAGVFVACLKNSLPGLSMRVTTDLGNQQALADFRRNIKQRSRELYRYIQVLIEYGWFDRFWEHWSRLDKKLVDSLPSSVLP